MLLQTVILLCILVVLPVLVGGIFSDVNGRGRNLSFRWVSGQLCLWAGFLAVCVPMILMPRENSFLNVIGMYGVFVAAMLLFSLALSIKRHARGWQVSVWKEFENDKNGIVILLQIIVLVLLAIQLVLVVVLAYEEGDDAFYVAISSITAESGTMYEILPYTGGTTGLDARHGLAPFPVWISMLSKVSGMHAATVAHIALPVVLIIMAYIIYSLIGRHLFHDSRQKQLLFLLFVELLVIFGGQSLYTAENFLLVRTAQGKAVLADIVIPFLFLLLLILFERLQQKEKPEAKYWLLMAVTMISGCLCSTQGALLTCMLLGVGSICAAVCYRSWKIIFPAAACCVVPVVLAFFYLFLG